MALKYLVNKSFLALEIVVKLALAALRRLNDVIGAGGTHSLLVKKIRRYTYDLCFCLVSLG
jgi:hypothetical protein